MTHAGQEAPNRSVQRCQHHSPSLTARTASIVSATLPDAEGHQETSPSRNSARRVKRDSDPPDDADADDRRGYRRSVMPVH